MGFRRSRQVAVLVGLLGVAALSVPATAAAQNTTMTSVDCIPGDRVVGSIPTTCSATVTDTGASPTLPIGNVSWSSDNPGTFTQGVIPTTQCALVPNGGTGNSFCQINYAPTAVGTGSHKLTAAYAGNGVIHDLSTGFFNLLVTDPSSDGGGGPTTTPTTAPPKKKKKCKKKAKGKKGAVAAKKCGKKKR